MGRRKLQIPNLEWKCYIPTDVAAQVDLILLDPLRGRAQHGARSELVASLLREWVAKQRKALALLPETPHNATPTTETPND